MKKIMMMVITAVVAAGTLVAAPDKKAKSKAESEKAKRDHVVIDQGPKLGRQSLLVGPGLAGQTTIGNCWTGGARKWIVLESKYTTYAKWTDRLTFEWHVILETKSATEKSKEDRATLAPYSYFNVSVNYANIPKGSHAASVVLPPSYPERFGEPRAVGLVIKNADGEIICGDAWSEIKGIPGHPKSADDGFWANPKVMDAKDKDGEPLIERRQGLQDRSKTIWALVNPNDYESVVE